MTIKNKIITAAISAIACAALIYAYSAGPDPWHTGAPGDDPLACSTAKCHVGTPLNGGGGSVVVNFPGGLAYTPGVQQTFTIVITDSAAKVWGFQMSARLASDLTNGQAGDFTAGTGQIVICSDQLGGTALFKGTKGCPPSSRMEFIEHYLHPFSTNTITVLWTPPASDVGDVHIYVAANAANGNTLETGDHIYTANYVLTPATGAPKPAITTISPNSVVAGSASAQLSISGSNFVSGAVVNFDSTVLQTVFTSSSALTATVPANLIATAGTASITVKNPDGGVSSGETFTIASAGPAITAVVSAATFLPGIQTGSWASVFGTNLSATTRGWGDSDFVNGKLPTNLDGVKVTVDNKPAAVSFISPGQINFQPAADANTGSVNVTVTNSNGTSTAFVAQLLKEAPGFFMFDQGGRKYIAALIANSDGSTTYLGPAGLFGSGGATTRPAKPGEILELYGTGFGPTNPVAPTGQILSGAFPITDSISVTIGGATAKVDFAGITLAGLYQLNVHVPSTLSPGDQKVVATVGGVMTPDGAFVTISK